MYLEDLVSVHGAGTVGRESPSSAQPLAFLGPSRKDRWQGITSPAGRAETPTL